MNKKPDKLAELLEAFALMDRSERIELLIGLADRFKGVPERIARHPYPEAHRVPHCESEAFVFSEPLSDETLKFYFAVENPQGISAMATAVILDQTLSGQPLEQVARVDSTLVYKIFGNELSTGKGLGLTGIVSMVRNQANRFLAQRASVKTQ